jgi:hypothetical protein
MSGLTLAPQWLSPSQPYPVPYLGTSELTQTWLSPSPDMSSVSALSRVKSLGLDMSGPQAGFQRWVPDMSRPWPGHVRISDTPTARFPWGAIKGPHASLACPATHFNMQTLCDTLLSSQALSSKLHSNPSFLGEIWGSLLSDPLNLQLKHFADDLRVFITLGDSFP